MLRRPAEACTIQRPYQLCQRLRMHHVPEGLSLSCKLSRRLRYCWEALLLPPFPPEHISW